MLLEVGTHDRTCSQISVLALYFLEPLYYYFPWLLYVIPLVYMILLTLSESFLSDVLVYIRCWMCMKRVNLVAMDIQMKLYDLLNQTTRLKW